MDDSYSAAVEPLLRSFRPEILKYFGNVEHDLKSDKSVVTELDRSIEKRIREELEKHFPDIGFEGEEYGKSGNTDMYWLIDPIDGTQNFIRGIKAVGTIIGLVKDREVVYAAIYDPIDNELFIAKKGAGVTLNGKKTSVSDRGPSNSFVDVGSPANYENCTALLGLLKDNRIEALTSHGAADRAMKISSGKTEGAVKILAGGRVWDYAPGNMMMREAGAVVTYYDGKNELESRTFSVLTPKLQDMIGDRLKEIIRG